jgi:hypothetical protein
VTGRRDVVVKDGLSVTVTVVEGSESTVEKVAAGCPSSTFWKESFGHADNLQRPVRQISGEFLAKPHSIERHILAQ